MNEVGRKRNLERIVSRSDEGSLPARRGVWIGFLGYLRAASLAASGPLRFMNIELERIRGVNGIQSLSGELDRHADDGRAVCGASIPGGNLPQRGGTPAQIILGRYLASKSFQPVF